MEMRLFQEQITELLTFRDDVFMEEGLEMHTDLDGCLSASFRGVAIPCEGTDWDVALDVIVEYVKNAVKEVPPH